LPASGADEKESERLTVRFPVEDLKALFGPFYKSKHASDFIAECCRVWVHGLVVQAAYQEIKLHRLNAVLAHGDSGVETLARRLADELAKHSSTTAPPE
jgi:hypothetical protein